MKEEEEEKNLGRKSISLLHNSKIKKNQNRIMIKEKEKWGGF